MSAELEIKGLAENIEKALEENGLGHLIIEELIFSEKESQNDEENATRSMTTRGCKIIRVNGKLVLKCGS